MSLRDELFNFQKEKRNLENKIFKQILEQCTEQIKYENEHSKYETIFTIPKFVIGLPLHNIKACIKFLMSELSKQGLKCKKTLNSDEIHISWYISNKELEKEQVKSTYKINNQKIINKLYDNDDLKILSSIFKK